MKKIFTSAAALLLFAGAANSQAARFVLFEHFTQASCGPCAAQNPAFESGILNPNPDKVRHIAFHTSWPGTDPMYTHIAAENDARTTYYGVSGVPDMYMNGNQKNAQPGGFSQADVDWQFSLGSPIKIKVTEVDNGGDRDVTVEVITVGTVPAGSYKLYTAIVENPIVYGTPPGSNGETDFPNVFRKMLPTINGDNYTPAAIGSSVTFNYNYLENGAWNSANIKVVAFVQNNTTKEVLNSGTVSDPTINYTLGISGASGAEGAPSMPTSFGLSSMNLGSSSEDFIYTLTTDAPGDWSANFDVNSTPFTTTGTVTTAAGATNAININVTPGTTPFVATYTLTVTSAAFPSSPSILKQVYVISGVTDLIVNNTGGLGSGTGGDASAWESVYTAGLTFAGNTGTAVTNDNVLMQLGAASALNGVNNIYYNIGWTFPSLTDNEIPNLENFLDNGGNLFIAGQDMGWEIMDAASGYGTPVTQGFFSGYLHAGFNADGGTANTQFNRDATDLVYGTAPSPMTINNYYGGSYFYPDELNVSAGGTKIFGYNATTKVAGLRYYAGVYKIVYLGIGPEMLSTTNANIVIKIAHDWFYGIITGTEADQAFESGFAVYPNPAENNLTVLLPEGSVNYTIYDATGKTIINGNVAGLNTTTISLESLQSGTYMISVADKSSVIKTLPFVKK